MGIDKKSYRRSLGLFELVSIGLGGTIGSGIFIVPGIVAGIAGPSSLLAWPLIAISASSVMFSLAKTTSLYPSTGAFYSIFATVFGKKISSFLTSMYLVAAIFGIATISAGVGQYLSFFGVNKTQVIEVLIIGIFCLINIRGIFLSGKTESVLTVAKTVPLIILAILLLPYIQEKHFVPFFSTTSTDFLKVLVIVYWTFTGFELSAIPAEEARNKILIFKSLKIVMFIVVFVYIMLNISLMGSLGSKELTQSQAPIAVAAGLLLKGSESVVAIIGIVAMLSALNAYLIGSSRVLQNLSLQFGLRTIKELSRWGTPTTSIILSAIASSVLLLFFSNSFRQLAEISVVATLLPYAFVCISAYKIVNEIKTRVVAIIGASTTLAILIMYFILV